MLPGFKYEAHGALKELTFGNGVLETRSYNARLQPMGVTANTLLSVSLGYGPDSSNDGNVASQTIQAGGRTFLQTYGYDGVNRITSGYMSASQERFTSVDPSFESGILESPNLATMESH